MTNQELNRDIKRLWRRFENRNDGDMLSETWIYETRKEWIRLWRADETKEVTKLEQLKMLLMINSSLRFKILHTLTYGWEIKKNK